MITEVATWKKKLKPKKQTRNETISATKPLKYCQTVCPNYSDGDGGAETKGLVREFKTMLI